MIKLKEAFKTWRQSQWKKQVFLIFELINSIKTQQLKIPRFEMSNPCYFFHNCYKVAMAQDTKSFAVKLLTKHVFIS